MAALISRHPVQKSVLKNCNSVTSILEILYGNSRKYLFYFVLWNLFIEFIYVFGGIWQHTCNVELENQHFSQA